MDWLVWLAVVFLIALGLAGTLLPGLPGGPLIFGAAALHKLLLPGYLSWGTVVSLALLAFLAQLAELAFTAAGAKRFGATGWGILGGACGALVGLLWGLPGIVGGAVLGAAACEVAFARRSFKEAARAGLGAALGLLASAVGRVGIALLMVLLFVLDCLIG